MTAASDSFTYDGGGNGTIAVNSGAELTASNSTFTLANLSLDNNSKLNGTDLTGDVFNMPISVPYNDVQYLGGNATFNDVDINAATLGSGTLNLNQIGTGLSLRYVFLNGFTVASGATLDVAANIKVLTESTLTDNGALNFATGDTVSLYDTQIVVNGTMTAAGDSFNNAGYTTGIAVNSGAELTASNSTFSLSQLSLDNNSKLNGTDLTGDVFNMPISVPYNDVQYLGNNETFNDVNINAATLGSGTLNLDQIGTALSLRYVFLNGFTVASGATLDVAANIKVLTEFDAHRQRRPELRHRRQRVSLRHADRRQRDDDHPPERLLQQRRVHHRHRRQLRRRTDRQQQHLQPQPVELELRR